MKTAKHNKRRKQQQQSGSGRAVLVTFYVARPRRNGGGAAAASSRDVHHHHHHHHHLHGGSNEARRRGSNDGGCYDRRADLLEYSRQLRATAATTLPPPPPPRRRDINTVGTVRDDEPAADDHKLGRRRLERVRSRQQIRQSCFGGAWNWKRIIMLVFPFHNNKESRRSRRNYNDSKNNGKAWSATQFASKLKIGRSSRRTSNDDKGLMKKLLCMFRQQSRLSR